MSAPCPSPTEPSAWATRNPPMSMDSWPAGSALGDGTALPLASSRASAERTEGNEGGRLHTAARVTGAARTPCGCGRAAAALIWPLIWEAAYAAARGQPAQSTPGKGDPSHTQAAYPAAAPTPCGQPSRELVEDADSQVQSSRLGGPRPNSHHDLQPLPSTLLSFRLRHISKNILRFRLTIRSALKY